MAFLTSEQVERLTKREIRIAFLVELQFTSQTAYVWNGNYDIVAGGQTWMALKGIGRVEGLGMRSDAASEQITLTLSGVPGDRTDILALALQQTPEANQQLAKVYIQFFDDEWQVVGDPVLIWFGFMQPPKVSRTTTAEFDGQIQTISVTAENAFFNRSRAPYGRNTDRDQQKRYSGDLFFQFTPSLLSKTFTYPDYVFAFLLGSSLFSYALDLTYRVSQGVHYIPSVI